MTDNTPGRMPPAREVKFQVRLDAELAKAAKAKAGQFGGLSPVVRALLRAYVRGDVVLSADDLWRELASAPRGRKPRTRKPPK